MNQQVCEQVVRFGPNGILVGVLSCPIAPVSPDSSGVLLVNAGLLHRVGPNRLYVSLARDLAGLGFPVLRFDFAGLGDSGRHDDNAPLEQTVVRDIDEALTFASERTGVRSWLLVGHCSGAIISTYVAQSDPRVSAVLAINFAPVLDPNWVTVDRDEKNARYFLRYYLKSAFKNPENWKRLLSGRVHYRRIVGVIAGGVVRAAARTTLIRLRSRLSVRPARDETSSAAGQHLIDLEKVVRRGARVHFVFSEKNAGLDYLLAATSGRLDTLLSAGSVGMEIIPRSDHLFSTLDGQLRLREIVRAFAESVQHTRESIGATV